MTHTVPGVTESRVHAKRTKTTSFVTAATSSTLHKSDDGASGPIQAPAFTALVFIFFAVLEGSGFRGGVAACEKDLGPTILKNWLVFVPATFINLGFVPLELRVLFINVVFFFWVIFLSLLINNDEASKQV